MIKTWVATTAIFFGVAVSVLTQPALGQPAGGPGGPDAGGPSGPPGPGGPGEPGPGFMHHMGPPPPQPSRGTVIRLSEGNRRIFIKCSEDDSTKACVDAIGPILNKLLEAK